MDEPIIIRYRWTVDEYLAALAAHKRRVITPIADYGFRGLALLFGVGTLITCMLQGWHWWLAATTLASFSLAVSPFLTRWQQLRQFAARPDKDIEIEVTITAEKLSSSNPLEQGESKWEALMSVVEAPNGFLLYPIPNLFNWLPKHAFPSEEAIDTFREWAKARVPKYRVI